MRSSPGLLRRLPSLDDYWAAIDRWGGGKRGWTNADLLEYLGQVYWQTGFSRHPQYIEHAQASSLVDLWEHRGAPERCRKQDGSWRCGAPLE